MGTTSLTPVEFHGASLFVLQINGAPFVALKPVVEAIGLDTDAQLKRIKRHPVLSTCTVITTVQMPGDDQAREVVCLPLDKLNGWLFGVTASRAKPEIRERLIQYQAECFDVLAQHFGAAVKPPVSEIPMQDKTNAAMEAANAVAAQVHAAVFKAIMAGGDNWKYSRWLVSFITDSKLAAPALVDRIEPDEMLTSFDRLVKDIDDPGLLVSNAQLANLTSAFSNRLARRMQSQKTAVV